MYQSTQTQQQSLLPKAQPTTSWVPQKLFSGFFKKPEELPVGDTEE
jgi:hypothetical protein